MFLLAENNPITPNQKYTSPSYHSSDVLIGSRDNFRHSRANFTVQFAADDDSMSLT